MDVDGTLTDGTIFLGAAAEGLIEIRGFSVRDGLGLSLAGAMGLEVAWITGRASPLVLKRAEELGVPHVCQRCRDKRRALSELTERLGLRREEVLYVGDDLNDLPAFEVSGVRVTVGDAPEEMKARAHWTTAAAGGKGAIREVVEAVLKAQGRWEEGIATFVARLLRDPDPPLQ
jgi:3-deoxy-D-manno-octulosonate 8-phosphate phosphatase (KDO 8-P phosphatase)